MPVTNVTHEPLKIIGRPVFDRLNEILTENDQRPIPSLQRLARLRGKGTRIIVAEQMRGKEKIILGCSFLSFIRRAEGTIAIIFDTLVHPALALPWEGMEDQCPTPPWSEVFKKLIEAWQPTLDRREILSEIWFLDAEGHEKRNLREKVLRGLKFRHMGWRTWVLKNS